MEYLKRFFKTIDSSDWLVEGFGDFCYSILGNLLPIWALILANFLNSDSNFCLYDSIHQPFTFVILSGTYLTSTFHLQSKPKMGSALLKFLYAPLLVIIGLLVANKSILDDLSAPFEIEVFVIIVFLVCFGFNTYIIFRSHYRRLNTSQQEGVDINRNNLEKDFDNL